jgi:hypothetical protein
VLCFRLPVQAPSVRSEITDFIRSYKYDQSYGRVFDSKRKRDEMDFMMAVRQMMTMCSTVCTIYYQSCYLFKYLSNGKGNDRIAEFSAVLARGPGDSAPM